MTWTPPELPKHESTKVYRQRDDANKPHAHKANRRDLVEIELMREHWHDDMSEDEWMSLCTKHAGAIYQNQKTRERWRNEDNY